ncbi:MAG TPA: pyridoxamine 5'-phosphate oxidase family protein [Microthrixaceae bacterium]|jgi:nitroimidazol reductase NimA-like FMN-containing flavoprotein (pyridoxamine 5'-phosphate oxidase superfamily)|nr:pyridoxamine 5'-phosphate oxidase family protein [Microthrixaceae bacterium]
MTDATSPRSELDLDWSGLEVLSYDECRRLLDVQPVGRIGFVQDGSPVILPINYILDGGLIVFRSGRGSKLDMAMMGRPVCVEVDSWDIVSHTGWSVLAKGFAEHVIDEDEIDRLDRLPVTPWSRPDARHEWIRVMVEELTGRRISH